MTVMQTLEQLRAGALLGAKSLKLSAGLPHFPTEILSLADTLEVLDLSGNRLSALPAEVAQLQKLKIAFFSDNDFTAFPAVLGQCPQLEMIGFKACQIRHIPEGALPKSLRWLILTDNQLEALPASIGQCPRLQKLMLAGNRLTHLPDAMAACQHLELLRLSANRLTQLPSWLFTLPRLAWLAFAGNPVSSQLPKVEKTLPTIDWPNLQLAEPLGEGASGIIYRAQWNTPQAAPTTVAVKIFKGSVTSDGLPEDEIKACLAAGPHPNLVAVLGIVTHHPDQKQALVLELIPAGYQNLGGPPSFESCTRDTFKPGTQFTPPQVLSIGRGIASVAFHLHERGLLHGDLYAHNILVNSEHHALFSDFGAATVYDRQDASLAVSLERTEVRAFGYLLEDLLLHIAPTATDQLSVQVLHQLKEDCLELDPTQRPAFKQLLERLANC